MSAITLPEYVSTGRLLDALGDSDHRSDSEKITFWLPPKCFISCGAIAHLVCWGQAARKRGTQIRFDGDSSSAFYLSRMDVFQHLGFDFNERYERHDETGRFTPARLVASSKDVFDVTNEILELILRQFDNAREFLPAVEWAINEIIDNVLLHSETPVPGVVCAQYFPKRHKLDIAVCDWGRGIQASMRPVLEPWEGVGEAVKKAVTRGVTRDSDIGQGNGLAGALQITSLNGGSFGIRTGNVVYRVKSGKEQGFRPVPEVPGTAVQFKLDTRNPVAMSDTFLLQPTWTYIDQQAELLSDVGSIRIVDECWNTGTREPAKRLRRKVLNLLPDVDEPITIDFDGVESTSSSFLDELIGRLIAEFGKEEFERRIQLVGMSQNLVDMTNVVVGMRIGDSTDQ